MCLRQTNKAGGHRSEQDTERVGLYKRTHTRTHKRTHTRTHTYTHTNTRTHTQTHTHRFPAQTINISSSFTSYGITDITNLFVCIITVIFLRVSTYMVGDNSSLNDYVCTYCLLYAVSMETVFTFLYRWQFHYRNCVI